MDGLERFQNKGFTLDTCAQINICKNPNIGNFLACIAIRNSPVFIPEITLNEAENKGFDKSEILMKLSQTLATKIVVCPVTISTRLVADQLEEKNSLLHHGDSAVLAFSLQTHSTLVTYDKDLLRCCEIIGLDAINPTKLMIEVAQS